MQAPGGSRTYRFRVPPPPDVEPVDRRVAVTLGLAAVAAAVVSIVCLELVYPALSWNRDEPVYLWHVGVLDAGTLTGGLGTPVDAFRPWLSGVGDDGYFSQYTLGWPLVLLASSKLLGTTAGAVVAGAVLHLLASFALVREVTGRNKTALFVAFATLASPAIVIQSGVHLSYLFTAGLGMGSLAAIWSGIRRGTRLPLFLAGAALGWVLLTRPYDAVVWGAVAVIGLVVRGEGARWSERLRDLWRLWPTVLVGLPFALATIAYNLRITGEALTFPIVATDPLDTFGFGRRRLMPEFEPTDYDVPTALYSSAKNGGFFVVFLAGNVVTAALATAGVWWRRAQASVWILVALAAAFPLGYFAFWGMHVSSLTARLVGAIYYLPSAVPVLALATMGLVELRRRAPRAATIALVAAVAVTVPVMVSRVDVNHRISAAQEAWAESVNGLEGPALVIVADSGPYLMFANPAGRNGPDLDDDILYAVDLGPGNLATIAAHPDRTVYFQVATADADELGPRETPVEFAVSLQPVSIERGSSLALEATFEPSEDDQVVLPFVELGGVITWGTPADLSSTPDGAFVFTTMVEPEDLPADATTLRVGFGSGASAEDARQDPRVRWEMTVAAEGDELIALAPARYERRFAVGPDFYWYPRPAEAGYSFQASIGS